MGISQSIFHAAEHKGMFDLPAELNRISFYHYGAALKVIAYHTN